MSRERKKTSKKGMHTEHDLSQFSIVVEYNVILTLASNAGALYTHTHTQ